MLIISRSKLHYTASGIISLKQVSGLKLLNKTCKYEQIVAKFMCEFFGCDYCVLLTINMLCRGYVYPVIKLIRKVLCLLTFMFV